MQLLRGRLFTLPSASLRESSRIQTPLDRTAKHLARHPWNVRSDGSRYATLHESVRSFCAPGGAFFMAPEKALQKRTGKRSRFSFERVRWPL